MAYKLELVPKAFDKRALATLDRAWAAVPKDDNDLSKGTEDISWKVASAAINCAAWILDKQLGPVKDNSFPTVAYSGPSDLRYMFSIVALMKLGYKVLLFNATLSQDGMLHLVDKTECRLFLRDERFHFHDKVIGRARKVLIAPTLYALKAVGDVETYPYKRTLHEGLMNPGLVLHTSGTTGLPKPVVLPLAHQTVAAQMICTITPLSGMPLGYGLFQDSRLFIGFPIAHSGGVSFSLFCSLYPDVVLVFGPGGSLTSKTLESLITYAGVSTALTMPRILIDAIKSESTLRSLERLRFLAWSGGVLPKDVGTAMAKRTRLMSSWGTTESGMHALHAVESEDWEYCHFSPSYNTLDFRPVPVTDATDQLDTDVERLYEVVATPNVDPALRQWQLIFYTYPEAKEWKFGNLWRRHPSKDHHWKYAGRLDDMIVLDSGHNFHPASYEQLMLSGDRRLKAVVIIGTGRPHLGAILELEVGNLDDSKTTTFRHAIDKVNGRSNGLEQIPVSGIIIATAEKPLPRTAKGSIARSKAEKLYEVEIERMYACVQG